MLPMNEGEFVLSVGRDQKIIFWNTVDSETIFIKDTRHDDIITDMIQLNDKFVTTCFDGEIKVFKMVKKK